MYTKIKMKRIMRKIVFGIAMVMSGMALSQTTEAEGQLKKATTDSVASWQKGALFNLGFSQVSLSNWAAGGVNSVSGNVILNLHANYIGTKDSWENSLNMGYGLLKQNSADIQKTDDNLEFTSKYGRKATDHWYYAGLVNFKTQFTDGFEKPGDANPISTFLAPGYLLGAAGMDYKPTSYFTMFVSPLTSKTTFVMDDSLSAAGAFGVDAGENIRNEFGGYLRASFNKEIMKNITLTSTIGLFSNYVENPENVDVNWDLLLLMKVNKYITVSLNTNLIYDDNINIVRDEDGDGINEINGPRTQFKEVLGVGFSYKL